MSLRGALHSLRPSSLRLWHEERRWHLAYLRYFREGDETCQWWALREMARCRDELDRRGVTHL